MLYMYYSPSTNINEPYLTVHPLTSTSEVNGELQVRPLYRSMKTLESATWVSATLMRCSRQNQEKNSDFPALQPLVSLHHAVTNLVGTEKNV